MKPQISKTNQMAVNGQLQSVINRISTLQAWGVNFNQIIQALSKRLDCSPQTIICCLYKNATSEKGAFYKVQLLTQIDDYLIEFEHQTAVLVQQFKRLGKKTTPKNQLNNLINPSNKNNAVSTRA